MRDLDDLKDLRREYLELVRIHGEAVTEFKRFKQSLLALNRKHRLKIAREYVKIISKSIRRAARAGRIGRKTGSGSGRRSQ